MGCIQTRCSEDCSRAWRKFFLAIQLCVSLMLPGPCCDGIPCAHSSFLLLVLAPGTFSLCALLLLLLMVVVMMKPVG